MLLTNVYAEIEEIRRMADMKQEVLSRRTGMSYRNWRYLGVNDTTKAPHLSSVIKLAEAMGFDVRIDFVPKTLDPQTEEEILEEIEECCS